MSETKKSLTMGEAAKVFLPLAGLFVIGFGFIALGGEAEPAKPAQNALGALYGAFRPWLVPSLITLLIVALLPILARHSARTADTPREGNALQAINAALIDERNQIEKRVKELEKLVEWRTGERDQAEDYLRVIECERDEFKQAAAMHHRAMLSKHEELDRTQRALDAGIDAVAAWVERAAEFEEERDEARAKLEQKAKIQLAQVYAVAEWFRANEAPGVAATRAYLREHEIQVPNAEYKNFSAFVQSLAPLPHQPASPVRDAATEKNSANARRERTRTRSRTQRRTPKRKA
jgi:hypothetical protein